MSEGKRRLAAIMFTDMLGYTALSQKSEALALKLLDEQKGILRPLFSKHNGNEVKTMGDAFLVEFASALEAVRCAYEIQETLHELNGSRQPENKILVRIGIHLGDVVHEENDVYGDAVNVASRIEPLATPGGICVTEQVFDQVRNKFEFPLASLGRRELKNVSEPLEVYGVILPWERQEGPAQKLDVRRIAVLPFRNMSPDPNDEYFADGMTEELITTLSKVGQLTVVARTSVMQYRNSTKRASEIAQELNTGALIEGSVRKAGNRVRITVQLLDAGTEGHLWAENYDRNLDDIFQIQSDVAKQVFEALRLKILPGERAKLARTPTSNAAAYMLYLRGRYHWNKRDPEETRRAARYFEDAVREDPTLAAAYVGLADCHELLFVNWHEDPAANHGKAKEMVARALELDPDLAEAHATRGLILTDEYDFRSAEGEFRRAIELEPSYATAHQWFAALLLAEAKLDEALDHSKTAVALDPFSQIINLNLAGIYEANRDFKTAAELYRKAIELNPGFGPAHAELGLAYGKLKMFEEAEKECEKGVEILQPYYPMVRKAFEIWMACLKDDKEGVKRALPDLQAHFAEAGTSSLEIAGFHFFLGDNDKGFEWLEKAYSEMEPGLASMRVNWMFDGVRTDPRYRAMLRKLGLE